MLIIYGLGNNEDKYLNTKHNIGRLVVEELASGLQLSYSKNKSYYYTKSKDIYLIYSAGYMNESGRPLAEFCKYNSVDSNTQLLIIHDDSDQIEGNVKLLPQGGSAGHHGINSIYREIIATPLLIENVWRLKVGIRPELNKLRSETFVLNRLTKVDEEAITKVAKTLTSQLASIQQGQWSNAQNQLNLKS
jgi:PTH1 family peptidyl-tRNA hydrolase